MRRLFCVLAALMLVTSALAISACGDDDDDDGGSASSGEGGGELVVASSGLDNADPTLYQTVQANQVFQLVYTPLVTYNHEEGEGGTEIVPGLAEAVPEPTNGGKTYEFTLRKGIVLQRRHPRQGKRLREHHEAPAEAGQRLVLVLLRDRRSRPSSRRRATSAPTSKAS